MQEKTAKKTSWSQLISSMEVNVKELESIILMLTPEKAYNLLNDVPTSQEFLSLLIELQSLHSVVLGMHPVSLYGKESFEVKGVREIYNNCLESAETLSKMISMALRLYAELKSFVQVKFLNTKMYCYDLLIKQVKGTGWSFYGIMLQIINLCVDLVSFFKYFEEFEKRKGELYHSRRVGELSKYGEEVMEKEKEISEKAKTIFRKRRGET